MIVNAEAVVIDSSLPSQTLAWVCSKVSRPIFARVVSVNKAERLVPVLGNVDTLVLSEAESQLISGIAVHDERTAHTCMEALAKAGVKHALMFVQGLGLIYRGDEETVTVPLPKGDSHALQLENGAASGAMSALLWARMEGRNDVESARLAAAAASLSMRQVPAVFPDLDAHALFECVGLSVADDR